MERCKPCASNETRKDAGVSVGIYGSYLHLWCVASRRFARVSLMEGGCPRVGEPLSFVFKGSRRRQLPGTQRVGSRSWRFFDDRMRHFRCGGALQAVQCVRYRRRLSRATPPAELKGGALVKAALFFCLVTFGQLLRLNTEVLFMNVPALTSHAVSILFAQSGLLLLQEVRNSWDSWSVSEMRRDVSQVVARAGDSPLSHSGAWWPVGSAPSSGDSSW